MSDAALALPALHVTTDDEVFSNAGFLEAAAALLRAHGERIALHLRAPGASGREIYDAAYRLEPVARETGARLLVNDRVDVALAVPVTGVQLGARSLGPAEARRLLGDGRWIGASVHSVEEAREAAPVVDFLVAGTLFGTESHPGRPGTGTAWLEELSALGRPVIGIGGITPARVDEVMRAGAAGVAVIRGIWDTADPAGAAQEYLRELEES